MDRFIHTELGSYRLIEVIRRGGMAVVYKAYQASLDRYVAVKVLEQQHDHQFVQRFKVEARIVAQLLHPNILQIYDYGEQDGFLYLVTQYVNNGASLVDVGKPMPAVAALELTQQILAALECAHAHGIIHRDVKPSNVLLPGPDWALLADFGIAKLLDGQDMTLAGQVIGTVAYMPPEQAAGERVDARTDIYAVGLLLYELLTGKLPFGSGPVGVALARQTSEPPPSPRSVNPALPVAVEPILLRALAKRPDDRYQSARAMAADLKHLAMSLAEHTEIASRPAPDAAERAAEHTTEILPPPVPVLRLRRAPAALVLLLLVALGVAGVLAWRGGAPPPVAPTAAAPGGDPGGAPLPAPTTTNPGGAAPQVYGRVAWRDKGSRNDLLIVSAWGLPPPEPGQVYAAWLFGANGSLALGALKPGDDGIMTVFYASPDAANLLGNYDRVSITKAPAGAAEADSANVILTGALPSAALVHMRHVLFSVDATPSKIGFALGLRQETNTVRIKAEALKNAFSAGDIVLEKGYAEELINIIEGSQGEHFGDRNGDGRVQNSGDGFGLLKNGQQLGYIAGLVDHALLAAAAPDATDDMKKNIASVQTAGETTRARLTDIRDRALRISQAAGIAETQPDVLAILTLAQQVVEGSDENKNGKIEPIPGEGGALTAYQYAQFMADMWLAPVAATPAPTQ